MKSAIKTVLLSLLAATSISASALGVGDQAPDFILHGTDGKSYSLSQFKDKEAVVIAWFPKAYTSGCTNSVMNSRAAAVSPAVRRSSLPLESSWVKCSIGM